MLILEPSKVLQPAVVSVDEEDVSRTVQLKHVTPLKVPPLNTHTHPAGDSLQSIFPKHTI